MQRLSIRLGLAIVLMVTVIFIVSVSFLFSLSKDYIRQNAVMRATQILDNTALRITDIMGDVETAADNMAWYVDSCQDPDSLIRDTREILLNNPHFHSCSISMEPDYFKKYGRYFSIYSVRDADSISTAQYGSDDFQYFHLDWYMKPQGLRQGCWIDPYLNTNPQATYQTNVITTYSRPLFNRDGLFIGVIAIDLELKWLSQEVTSVAPYPNSSCIMIGSKGQYLVHPDTLKLISQTIFSDPDPKAKEDIDSLGKKMIAGESGVYQLVVDGNDALVLYRPVGKADWSMAIVCPEDDVFSGYNRLLYSVWVIVFIGLLVIMLFCYQAIGGAIAPLHLLAHQARDIAEGRYSNSLPKTSRGDTIGQLQNSFVDMQQSLSDYISNIRLINTQMEHRNCELLDANEKALEADRKKTVFLQDMMHQIRTPLNIIGGFAQVLNDSFHEMSADESKKIIQMMQDNVKKITRISRMLVGFASQKGYIDLKKDTFSCNAVCREMIDGFQLTNPYTVKLCFETTVPDNFMISTDKQRVMLILEELLDNANKFTHQGKITVAVSQPDDKTVAITVSDTGIGVAEAHRQMIFSMFSKVDLFTEGVGLGLPLSKRAANRIGGDLVLDSAYKEGASFILTIPINK
jgi:signal transduction histidine kinase